MFQHYIQTFWRNLVRNKTYSFLNILGLSAGLTCFALIALWVVDELSFDQFNREYKRIYRLVGTARTQTGVEESATTSAPMAQALVNDYPEVENAVRIRMREEIITHKGEQVLQPGILLADPSFFQVFSYRLSRGHPERALREPYSVILAESAAKKYFGTEDPMGKTLRMNMYDSTGYGAEYTVTGLMPDPPNNAHFTFSLVASFKTVEVARPDVLTTDGWGDASFYTYLLLKKGVDHVAFSRKIRQFYGKYIGDLFAIWKDIYSYQLQPLQDIHLRSRLQNEISPQGNVSQVYIFSLIGLFILLLAGINYTNLATARSLNRAREVGIKKVVGAGKRQLVVQYLSESVFTALLAFLLSVIGALLLEPVFQGLTGKKLSLIASPLLLGFLLITTIILGLLAGIYPATVLSGFRPVLMLKGAFISSGRGIQLRKALVVLQFVITIGLIAGIVIIYEQMSFIKHKDLGYDRDALHFLRVNGNTDVVRGYSAFKNELQKSPLIAGVATSNSLIVGGLGTGGAETVDAGGRPLQVNTARLRVDTQFLNVYGIKLIAGRHFSGRAPGDTLRPVLLNQTAVRKTGWQSNEDAVGKPFRMGSTPGVVVGVVEDFHYASLEQPLEPLAIYPLEDHFSRITCKVDVRQTGEVIAWLEKVWKKHFPGVLFDYDFVNRQIAQQYQSEERFARIFLYFSFLSLLIACLGLFGLISYTIVQRVKEIGIRKVLGATATGITILLSKDLLKLVVLACLIAVPVAWYLMSQWLADFAYRIHLSWWMFMGAFVLVFIIAMLTVSVHALRAALSNPVKSLRSE